MAKTERIQVPDELKNLQRGAIEQRDRFFYGVAQAHKRLPSKRQARLLRRPAVVNSPMEGRGSLFRFLSPLWRSLDTTTKNIWRDAGAFSNLTNWQVYISDNAARIRNSLSLDVPPSEEWQVRTGYLSIVLPADEIILKQEHPQQYYIAEPIPGRTWKDQVVDLTESFSLPLQIGISYTSDLSPVSVSAEYTPPNGDAVDFVLSEYTPPDPPDFSFSGGGSSVARFFARIVSSYQGVDRYTDLVINFDPVTDWTKETVSISQIPGYFISYTLFVEISGYRGTLLFDNVRSVHGGTNWARDPRCDDITKKFVKGFSAVPSFWIPVSLPSGSSFSTVFPPAL